jgi:hypothetical protein
MNLISKLLVVSALLLTGTTIALADIPNPDPPKKSPDSMTRMRIVLDADQKQAKLVIPRSLLQQMRAGADGENATGSAAFSGGLSLNRTQTLAAGVFLSLALSFTGLWFITKSKGSARLKNITVASLAVSGLLLTGMVVRANAGPPTVARSLTSKVLIQEAQWYGVYGQVTVEVTNDGDEIKLVVPLVK